MVMVNIDEDLGYAPPGLPEPASADSKKGVTYMQVMSGLWTNRQGSWRISSSGKFAFKWGAGWIWVNPRRVCAGDGHAQFMTRRRLRGRQGQRRDEN
ncbi:MAG: hypothetical protein OXG37_08805 [Actinomycetia bacterium]|nr:hypothetical protein [Actinomycetes bacterium]